MPDDRAEPDHEKENSTESEGPRKTDRDHETCLVEYVTHFFTERSASCGGSVNRNLTLCRGSELDLIHAKASVSLAIVEYGIFVASGDKPNAADIREAT